jgi:hypothetical protein
LASERYHPQGHRRFDGLAKAGAHLEAARTAGLQSGRAADGYLTLHEDLRANLPAEFNVAMSNHDAVQWLALMRKNPQRGALDGCTPGQVHSTKEHALPVPGDSRTAFRSITAV